MRDRRSVRQGGGAACRLLHQAHLAGELVSAERGQPRRGARGRPVHAGDGERARAHRSVRSRAAIPASARLLNELRLRFGNLGLAAAAYNAGPTAVAHWLANKGSLPFETEDYVLAVTGHNADEWRSDKPPAEPAPDKSSSCLSLVATLRVTAPSSVVSGWFAPWGVQIAASFSKGSALRAFARARHEYASVIGDMNPFVLGSVLRSRGWRPFYRVRLPAQTGGEARRLCDRIQAVGGRLQRWPHGRRPLARQEGIASVRNGGLRPRGHGPYCR